MSERKKVAAVSAVITFILTLVFVGGVFLVLIMTNFQDLGNLYAVVNHMRADGLQNVQTKSMVDGAIKGIASSINDPYTVYLEPKNYTDLNEKIKGSFGGVGIVVESKDNMVVVLAVIKGTPAEKANIKSGDVIAKIDDKDTTGMSLDEAANLIRGQEGTKVKLTLVRKSMKNVQEYVLQRKIIEVPTVDGDLIEGTKIGLIHISQFNSKTGQELRQTLDSLKKKGMQAIILDLRDNPGGELIAATEVAEMFIPKGPIVFIDYRVGTDEEYTATGNNIKLPMVVLVNGGSASASEIVAGAIKDTKSATLIGTKTFGKGIVQTIFELNGGAGLKLTTARYLTPNKNDINKKGIMPDIVIQQPDNTDKDVQMEKALEIIKQKI